MRLTGAQIVTQVLLEQGCDTVFGYPGGQVLALYDALYQKRRQIRHIRTAHEQGAAHAADGYARATGKPGVVIATSGPGATNLVTGIATAYLDSVPMVAITGNVPCDRIGLDCFQEVDITGITIPITKHNFMVKDIRRLADTLREAFTIAKSGRPGPVLVDIPSDIQKTRWEYTPAGEAPMLPTKHAAAEQLEEAVRQLTAAQRPYISCGGGVIRAKAAPLVQELARRLDCGVGATLMGLSAMPGEDPRFLGMQGLHGHYAAAMAQREADLILVAGARFSDRAVGEHANFAPDAKILHIDIDAAELEKTMPVYLGIEGDIRDALERLLERIPRQSHPAWQQRLAQLKQQEAEQMPPQEGFHPAGIIRMLSDRAGDAYIATDVGEHQMWTAQHFSFRTPGSFLTSGGLGTMGFGMGAAIGAAIGTGKPTILITGDGSFRMNFNELATAVEQKLPLTILLLENHTLGMVRQSQTLYYKRRYAATDLGCSIDYPALAEACGAVGLRAESYAQLDQALTRAAHSKKPVLILCPVDPEQMVFPMLPPGGRVEDMLLAAPKSAQKHHRKEKA